MLRCESFIMQTLMAYDFDTLIDRRNSDSDKWRKYADPEVIPMWVADMDFRAPPEVIDALKVRAEHGVFGYVAPPPALTECLLERLQRYYQWSVQPEWLVWLPGLVSALNVCCRMLTPEQTVLTTTPVYHPFLYAPDNMNRALTRVPLALDGSHWRIDFERLEAAVTPQTRLFMLCNPHNPVGRVYDHDELTALAEFCQRHDVLICADEIHCELVLDPERRHWPLATLGEDIAARSITLMAPSKTFNLAGLYCGFAIIPDAEVRRQFNRATTGIVGHVNSMGYAAALAAYQHGEPWRQALLAYLRASRAMLQQWAANTPGVQLSPLEATYLAWIDCRERGLDNPAAVFERFKVGVHDGRIFDAPPGFVRLNFACPHSRLQIALERISQALDG